MIQADSISHKSETHRHKPPLKIKFNVIRANLTHSKVEPFIVVNGTANIVMDTEFKYGLMVLSMRAFGK